MVQSVLNISNPASRSTHRTYSKEKDRRELAKMVAVCGLPFSFPSYPGFVHYIRELYNLDYEGIPRNTIKSDLFKYQKEYSHFFVVYLLIMMVDYLLLLIWDIVQMVTIILYLLSIGLTMNGTCKNEY